MKRKYVCTDPQAAKVALHPKRNHTFLCAALFAACLLLQVQASFAIPTSGLISHWKADGNANDSVDGNNGTLFGTTFASGKNGQAFSLDGVNDYVRIPDSANLNPAHLTIGFWFNSDQTLDASVGFMPLLMKFRV